MRRHCSVACVLLGSIAILGLLQRSARSQAEPATSTIRLASGSEASGAVDREPPSQAWPRHDSELSFEQLHRAAPSNVVRTSATKNSNARNQNGVQQAGYVESPATKPLVDVAGYNRSRSLAGVYPSASAQATLNKLPRPVPVQQTATAPAAQPTHQRGKPFQAIQTEPELSPYLNLYRTNLNPNMMPNYFALVRPQFEQQELNRKQTTEIQKLQRQLQSNQSAAASSPYSAGSSTGMSVSARYMDTGQFYKPSRR